MNSPRPANRRPLAIQMGHRLREGLLLVTIAVALFLLLSFATWHHTDPGWLNSDGGAAVLNRGGRVGAFVADIFLLLFGCMAWLTPFLLVWLAWSNLQDYQALPMRKENDKKAKRSASSLGLWVKLLGFVMILVSSCGLAALLLGHHFNSLPASAGGAMGDLTASHLKTIFNFSGSLLILVTGLFCGVTLFSGLSWLGLSAHVGDLGRGGLARLRAALIEKWQTWQKRRERPTIMTTPVLYTEPQTLSAKSVQKVLPTRVTPVRIVRPEKPALPMPKDVIKQKNTSTVTLQLGMLPPLTLLDAPPPPSGQAFSDISFEALSQLVEQRLQDFGVEVKVVAVHPGPIITRFELDLAPGIKVSKITGLAKDIARSLMATSVRVVEVIPGKSVIGLELPNQHREIVGLRDILESQRYIQAKSPVSLVLGKDIAGFPVVVDLAKMPHLLVAGTTGSGKSVSLNAMLLSMLFKATPEQLRLILIDPKMLELSIYEGIPHLLTPVITDMKDAANALRWCVAEMDRRYRLMASLGVRNLAGYNLKVTEASQQGNPIPAPEWLRVDGNPVEQLAALPTIVVVADELADMMMVVGKKVEELIARIAQKARAAGIHLIVATQRPSVDVITGLIKANIPTRVAFQVSSRIDSRTILDQQGAEQLLGNGDMLYLPPGTGVPVRVHGAFVADEEVHRVVAAWQTYAKPEYIAEVTDGGTEGDAGEAGTGEHDPLYDQALRIITDSRRASVSLIQRRLKIGFNRAARIMEELEASGVVSGVDQNGAREVLAPEGV